MKPGEALKQIYDLAAQNVIDERDEPEIAAQQREALSVVSKLFGLDVNGKKLFNVSWTYTDNMQGFETSAYLTDAEGGQLQDQLKKYEDQGAISDGQVYPYNLDWRPHETLEDVRKEIHDALEYEIEEEPEGLSAE